MVHALHGLGFAPIMYIRDPRRPNFKTDDFIRIITRFVKSRVPVIALFPGHSITIIGHTFTPTPSPPVRLKVIPAHQFVSALIYHDDAGGPYRLLPVTSQARKQIEQQADPWRSTLLSPEKKWPTADDIRGVIFPLPPDVFLVGEGLTRGANDLIELLAPHLRRLQSAINPLAAEFLQAATSGHLVLRSYFMNSKKFKEQIALSTNLSEHLRAFYQSLRLPLYVWISEFTTVDRYRDDETILGEIISDATANENDVSFISAHLPGMVLTRDVNTEKILLAPISSGPVAHPSYNQPPLP